MSKTSMVAAKSFRYAGRALRPGDTFDASKQDARLLHAIQRADYAPEPVPGPVDDAEDLRDAYEAAFGKAADKRWSPKRLRDELDKAGTYSRRDMRAED